MPTTVIKNGFFERLFPTFISTRKIRCAGKLMASLHATFVNRRRCAQADMIISKTIRNIVFYTLIPFLGFIVLYVTLRFNYSTYQLNPLDLILLIILILGIHLYFESLQIVKKGRFKKELLSKGELSKNNQIYQQQRIIIADKKIYLNTNSVDILNQENRIILHYDPKENFLEIRKNFSKIKIPNSGIKFLILENDIVGINTLQGWLTRGELDKKQSICIISAKLISGKIISLFQISFAKTILSDRLNFPQVQEEDYNLLSQGMKTIMILSQKLDKEYLVIDYKNKKPV
ncbi:hypothetical protein V6B16_14965, partial [Salinimicrobium catena]|uniref:hypothetical protein n=1 Tax=Salinimicrobium catena TaxID=390640 RepID=UPI002FE4EF75